ncbi:GLMPB protein, partial [Tricholaema leucomelas]|nr:GLMPB protein [Tricholaema leucomelas]
LRYNPGRNSSDVNVLHVRAQGRADTLHYVWSSLGAPAVLLVATRGSCSSLRLDWNRLLSPTPGGAIWFDPPGSVLYSAAVAFTKVYEAQGGSSLQELFYPPYDLAQFSWASIAHSLDPVALTAELKGTPGTDPAGSFANGSLAFRVTAYEGGGRDRSLPRLLHSANSSKVEFILAGLAPRGNSSELLLEVAAVEEVGVEQRLSSGSSSDDEYSPSVFQTLSLLAQPRAPAGAHSSALSFLHWRAAAYSSPSPRRQDGLECHPRGLQAANWTLPANSLLRAYFGEGIGTTYTVSALNISFGGQQGELYQERRYLSWSALLGFGQPPKDLPSPLVISITALALGTPLLLLLLGSCLLLCARRKGTSDYQPIN